MKELERDYVDYYLVDWVGGGEGMKSLDEGYIENGVVEFLVKEGEEGGIGNLGW